MSLTLKNIDFRFIFEIILISDLKHLVEVKFKLKLKSLNINSLWMDSRIRLNI